MRPFRVTVRTYYFALRNLVKYLLKIFAVPSIADLKLLFSPDVVELHHVRRILLFTVCARLVFVRVNYPAPFYAPSLGSLSLERLNRLSIQFVTVPVIDLNALSTPAFVPEGLDWLFYLTLAAFLHGN